MLQNNQTINTDNIYIGSHGEECQRETNLNLDWHGFIKSTLRGIHTRFTDASKVYLSFSITTSKSLSTALLLVLDSELLQSAAPSSESMESSNAYR